MEPNERFVWVGGASIEGAEEATQDGLPGAWMAFCRVFDLCGIVERRGCYFRAQFVDLGA